ncbi:MAG: hypothetical protein JKY95_09560 [Planctomycetaceae bacterium]|nr:hypothetical protein [Planctomycetaceae bacterium]
MKISIQKPLLKVTRGKTKNPFRPIDSDRFLIGAGNCCQLQLSAEEIPMVYAIVHQVQGGCQIEALYSEPVMLVNGVEKQFAILQPGDSLSFGAYEFEYLLDQAEHVLRATDVADQQVQPVVKQSVVPMQSEPVSLIPAVPEKIEDLTASELVARIEKELELLDELEQDELEQESEISRKIA